MEVKDWKLHGIVLIEIVSRSFSLPFHSIFHLLFLNFLWYAINPNALCLWVIDQWSLGNVFIFDDVVLSITCPECLPFFLLKPPIDNETERKWVKSTLNPEIIHNDNELCVCVYNSQLP